MKKPVYKNDYVLNALLLQCKFDQFLTIFLLIDNKNVQDRLVFNNNWEEFVY